MTKQEAKELVLKSRALQLRRQLVSDDRYLSFCCVADEEIYMSLIEKGPAWSKSDWDHLRYLNPRDIQQIVFVAIRRPDFSPKQLPEWLAELLERIDRLTQEEMRKQQTTRGEATACDFAPDLGAQPGSLGWWAALFTLEEIDAIPKSLCKSELHTKAELRLVKMESMVDHMRLREVKAHWCLDFQTLWRKRTIAGLSGAPVSGRNGVLSEVDLLPDCLDEIVALGHPWTRYEWYGMPLNCWGALAGAVIRRPDFFQNPQQLPPFVREELQVDDEWIRECLPPETVSQTGDVHDQR